MSDSVSINIKGEPTRIKMVKMTPSGKERVPEVKTGQIFDNDNLFHPEGLYSAEIFGRVGTEERTRRIGRIELNVKILHPGIYKEVLNLGGLYRRVMEGKENVIYDDKTRDLVPSDDPKAKTGFSFFIKHIDKIKFKKTGSIKREFSIKLVEKAVEENTAITDSLIVIPAGYRDYMIGRDGRPEEDEINTLYRKVIARSSLIDPKRSAKNPELYDDAAIGIQKAVLEVYEYLYSLIDGKRKAIQNKWLSRRIFNTTSNVASAYVDKTTGNNDPRKFGYNDCRMGLHQYCRNGAPLTVYNVRNKYIPQIFPDNSNVAYLTNMKTLKREEVIVKGIQKEVDLWTTKDGIEKIFASLGNPDVRTEYIRFNTGKDGHCIGLLYRDNKYFKFFQDIDELPPELSRENVRPVTLVEFIYMSIYHMSGQYPSLITRYPITGYGSIFPAMTVVVPTIDNDTLIELDPAWKPMEGDENRALFFPRLDSNFINTLIVHVSKLGRLGGDYDGDTMHAKMLLSREAVEEVKTLLNRKEYYVDDSGKLYFSNSNAVLDSVIKTLS